MDTGTIFIISIISIIVLLVVIYQSKYEILKRFTTIVLIGYFSWAIGKGGNSSFIMFFVATGFFLYVCKSVDNDKEKKERKTGMDIKYEDFVNLIVSYGGYMELNPLPIEEIRNSNVLPFSKNKLIECAPIYIKRLEKHMQESLLVAIPELAFYKEDIPENGYKSNMK